jgi:hypothetical protein
MKIKRSISSVAIIDMAINNSKFNTRKSKINRKWTRYLKNKKLFDEYMVYLANRNAAGAEPSSYRQLSNICHNLMSECYHIEGLHIQVDWVKEFHDFAWNSIKWYDVKNVFLYMINNGYQ